MNQTRHHKPFLHINLNIIYKEHGSQSFICPRWLNSSRQHPCGKNSMQRPGQMIQNPVTYVITLRLHFLTGNDYLQLSWFYDHS